MPASGRTRLAWPDGLEGIPRVGLFVVEIPVIFDAHMAEGRCVTTQHVYVVVPIPAPVTQVSHAAWILPSPMTDAIASTTALGIPRFGIEACLRISLRSPSLIFTSATPAALKLWRQCRAVRSKPWVRSECSSGAP